MSHERCGTAGKEIRVRNAPLPTFHQKRILARVVLVRASRER
jgi:hypothetical protein